MYELGHRRIAFMRGPRAIPDSEFRWESIQQVAKEMDLKLDPALVIRIDAAGWSTKDGQHPMAPEIGYKPMQALLEKTRDFTAVFCFNDIAAIGAIRALKDAGLSVPGDVSVVGFDDILSAAYATPSLTTVRQPLTEMGRRGAQVLLERIADREKAVSGRDCDEPGAGGARVDGRTGEDSGDYARRERCDTHECRAALEPAADVDLRVGFAAIVARARRIGGFLGPFVDGQLRAVAVDDDPAHRIFALLAANFTSINSVDHGATSR